MRSGIAFTIGLDTMGIDKNSPLAHQCDIGMSQYRLYPTPQLSDHLRLTRHGLSKGSTVYVGLRGDAAPVQTCAAHVVVLEDDRLQAMLGSQFGGSIATGTRADDDKVCTNHIFHLSSFI